VKRGPGAPSSLEPGELGWDLTNNQLYCGDANKVPVYVSGSPMSYPISVANGGTGATSASGAMTNLGAANYVIEEGDSNNWHYRKWNNNYAECWLNYTATGSWSATSNWYYLSGTVNYPFTFASAPIVTWNAESNNDTNPSMLFGKYGANMNKTTQATFTLYRFWGAPASTAEYLISIYACGQLATT